MSVAPTPFSSPRPPAGWLAVTVAVVLLSLFVPLASVAVAQPAAAQAEATPFAKTLDSLDELTELQARMQACVEKVRQAVVGIRIGGSSGSGTIVTADGWIVTCAHVTTEVERDCVAILHDGRQLRGKSKGLHGAMDYALIKVETNGEALPTVEMGKNADLVSGQWVMAMGHPLGFQRNRPPVVRFGRVLLPMSPANRIVHDAPLISGDSGGPLFDLEGKLVGINVSIDGARVFVNNASPIDEVTANWESLQAGVALDRSGGDFDRQVNDAEEKLAAGDFAGALAAFERLGRDRRFADRASDAQFGIARVQAAWAASHEDTIERENRQRLAVLALKSAVEGGYENLHALLHAAELADLRETSEFKAAVEAVREKIRSGRPFIGIQSAGEAPDTPGVPVGGVVSGSAAQAAGLRIGDILLKIGETPLDSLQALQQALGRYSPGDEVTFEFRRGEETLNATIILGKRPEESRPQPNQPAQPRARIQNDHFRATPATRGAMQDTVADARRSVCKIYAGTTVVAFGVIVRSNGYILTKLSELKDADVVGVELPDGRRMLGAKINADDRLDLALIRVQAQQLHAVQWFDGDARKLPIGKLVAAVGSNPVPESLGVLSLQDYSSRDTRQRPFVGIMAEDLSADQAQALGVTGGFRITQVTPNTGAAAAGLRPGDIVVQIEGEALVGMETLHEILDQRRAGDRIRFAVVRGEERLEITIALGRRPEAESAPGDQGGRADRAAMLAGPRNDRRTGFGPVIQTDAVVAPNQQGALLVDLDGRVLGMSIARFDRTITFALPADVVKAAVERLIATAEEDF